MSFIYEHYVSRGRTAATASWTLAGVLLAAAWGVVLAVPGDWPVGMMLAATSVVTAIIAATLQVRCYMVRVCALIREKHPDVVPRTPLTAVR